MIVWVRVCRADAVNVKQDEREITKRDTDDLLREVHSVSTDETEPNLPTLLRRHSSLPSLYLQYYMLNTTVMPVIRALK
jgi:hypothetical protein